MRGRSAWPYILQCSAGSPPSQTSFPSTRGSHSTPLPFTSPLQASPTTQTPSTLAPLPPTLPPQPPRPPPPSLLSCVSTKDIFISFKSHVPSFQNLHNTSEGKLPCFPHHCDIRSGQQQRSPYARCWQDNSVPVPFSERCSCGLQAKFILGGPGVLTGRWSMVPGSLFCLKALGTLQTLRLTWTDRL